DLGILVRFSAATRRAIAYEVDLVAVFHSSENGLSKTNLSGYSSHNQLLATRRFDSRANLRVRPGMRRRAVDRRDLWEHLTGLFEYGIRKDAPLRAHCGQHDGHA